MGLFLRSCATAVAFAVATGAAAQTINTAMNLPTGSTIDLVIEKTREHSGSQPMPKVTITSRYRQAIQSTDEGYVVTQTLTGIDAPPEAQAMMQDLSAAMKTVTFETDASLAPIKIRDRAALLEATFGSVNALVASATSPEARAATEQAMTAMRGMFDQMPDEQLAQSLLKEQAELSQFQSMEIDLSEPINRVIETPNPAGGPAFRQTIGIKLEGLDKKAGRAVISSVDEMDPEALKASSMALLQQLAPQQREKIAAELAAAKMEMRNACRYDVDLKTGLTTHSDCTRTVTALGGDGGLVRRVDRTVATQTLTLP